MWQFGISGNPKSLNRPIGDMDSSLIQSQWAHISWVDPKEWAICLCRPMIHGPILGAIWILHLLQNPSDVKRWGIICWDYRNPNIVAPIEWPMIFALQVNRSDMGPHRFCVETQIVGHISLIVSPMSWPGILILHL